MVSAMEGVRPSTGVRLTDRTYILKESELFLPTANACPQLLSLGWACHVLSMLGFYLACSRPGLALAVTLTVNVYVQLSSSVPKTLFL